MRGKLKMYQLKKNRLGQHKVVSERKAKVDSVDL